jgi:hypothetical protein
LINYYKYSLFYWCLHRNSTVGLYVLLNVRTGNFSADIERNVKNAGCSSESKDWHYNEMYCQYEVKANLMFRWPCIVVYQYSETNVMHILFNLLRIKGLYMFRALLVHPQEALHKRHLVYCVRVMTVGCYQGWRGTGVGDTPTLAAANWHNTHAIYQVPLVERLLKMRK